MRWACHTPSTGPEAYLPDFVGFNKKAACHKITTAKDLKHYRKEHDMVAGTTPRDGFRSARGKLPGRRSSTPTDSFAFGRKVRPSTPIQEVLSNRFGDRSERELDGFYNTFREAKVEATTMVRRIPLTTASRGHASSAKKAQLDQELDHRDLFKLTRFTKRAMPKVHTRLKPAKGREWGSYTPDLDLDHVENEEGALETSAAIAAIGQEEGPVK
jgi:hypothetical protein